MNVEGNKANNLRNRRLCLVLYALMLETKLELIVELDFARLKFSILTKNIKAYCIELLPSKVFFLGMNFIFLKV